jgi:transcriptional regulator with XRE-family HTH domain
MVTFIQKMKGAGMDLNMANNVGRARFVKQQREERAWPQRQLAEIAGVNLRTIQRLERDGSASFETLMGVAQAFEIDVKQLSPTSRTQKSTLQKEVHLLPRLALGKELAAVIGGADQFQFEHDEAESEKALGLMVDVLEVLKSDVVRWHDADAVGKLKIEFELSQAIKELEAVGFYLFGVKRIIPRIVCEKKTLITMSTLYMSHSRSLKIIRDRKSNMVIPAALSEVAI